MHSIGEVEGSGQVSRPTTKGEVEGSGLGGVSRLTPGVGSRPYLSGLQAPHLGGLQAHTQWGYPSMH